MTEKLRAPFVWTPRQAIDPAGFRKHYLGADARPNEKNRWFLFRKTVRLDARPTAAPLSITVDGRYVLYVNGVEAGPRAGALQPALPALRRLRPDGRAEGRATT